MKFVSVLYLSIVFLLMGCSEKKENSHSTIAGLSWSSDIETSFKIAQKENKNVIVMVGEDSCKWCKKMQESTLINKSIQEKMKQYILVYIKRSDKVSLKFIPEFDGKIPSFFFMQANQEIIEPVVGYFEAVDFLSYIEEIEG